MKRIAVWNTAFLGDAVLTLPLLQNLIAAYPHAEIDFYVRGGVAPLFASHPSIRHVISYDKRGRQGGIYAGYELSKQIRRASYDLFMCAHTSFRSGMLARLSNARRRIGYIETPNSSLWFTDRVSRRFQELPEIDRLLGLLAPLALPIVTKTPEIYLPQADMEKAERALGNMPFPLLGIHPGSVWETKRWPSDFFAQVAVYALRAGVGVVLLAGPSELEQAEEVRGGIKARVSEKVYAAQVMDYAGKLSLTELAAYIGKLSHYVTNDSGPMHIAWSQNVPVTAIFGPTTKELGFFPQGKSSKVAETSLSCRPCGLHGGHVCPNGHHLCMRNISPKYVWTMVKERLLPR